MTIAEAKALKGGDKIQNRNPIEFPVIGVIVDRRILKRFAKAWVIIQWIGGGFSMWSSNEPRQWELYNKIP